MNSMYNINGQKIFKNVKTRCYIASKLESIEDDEDNEITQYDTPQKYVFNIQPLVNSAIDGAEIQAFGELAQRMKVAVVTERDKYKDSFKEFDLAYLDGATPEGELYNGQNANYIVHLVALQNTVIRIFFTKIVK